MKSLPIYSEASLRTEDDILQEIWETKSMLDYSEDEETINELMKKLDRLYEMLHLKSVFEGGET